MFSPSDLPPEITGFSPRPARFPIGLVLGTVGFCIVLIGSLLGTYIYKKQTLGVPMIASLQHVRAEAVTRIIVQPALGGGRRASAEFDPNSLTTHDVEITDSDALSSVMEAIRHAAMESQSSDERTSRWECNLLIQTPDRAWRCHATNTGQAVYLDFWSNVLSGWALGTLRSQDLIEALPHAANVTPP